MLYRLSKDAYKKATLHLDLSVPEDLTTVYKSSVLVHLARGFSILLMLVKFAQSVNKYQKPFKSQS